MIPSRGFTARCIRAILVSMMRAWGGALGAIAIFTAFMACGSGDDASGAAPGSDAATDSTSAGDVGASDGGSGTAAIGSPCLPSPELSTSFDGFRYQNVTVDDGNPGCSSSICLVNHFQGRTTCPYGQTPAGANPAGGPGCTAPGSGTGVSGQVSAQCFDRTAAEAVTCSCRCANADGKTDDGASYCTCPSGTACTQVVPEFVFGDPNAGGYCTPTALAAYSPSSSCAQECDSTMNKCTAPSLTANEAADGGATTYSFSFLRTRAPIGCLPDPLPTNASGADCDVFEFLATGACADTPGLTNADPQVAASLIAVASGEGLTGTPPVCKLAQIAQPCTDAGPAGWCYATGANAPSGCSQSILFSGSGTPNVDAGVLPALACP